MSLSAKQCILKLRETEYKLQKLQNDLLKGNNDSSPSMTEFLTHHKELMALPGSSKNSIPFRFSFQAQKRYYEVQKAQKLTLPPKNSNYIGRIIKPFKDTVDDSERDTDPTAQGLAKHKSSALQTLYNQLDEQTSKMAIAFPKIDKFSTRHKIRSKQGSNTRGLLSNTRRKQQGSALSSNNNSDSKKTSATSILFNSKQFNFQQKTSSTSKSIKLKEVASRSLTSGEISKDIARTAADIRKLYRNDNESKINTNISTTSMQSQSVLESGQRSSEVGINSLSELRQSVALALGSSNLMGVFLPSNSKFHNRRGPAGWSDRVSTASLGREEKDKMTAKDALNLLKRRLPERSILAVTEQAQPHRRGLIGVEISSFEPECAVFYRDRNGNYNPHLHHSKNIEDNMKNSRVSKLVKHK